MKNKLTFLSIILLTAVVFTGCRGYRSEKTPIHLNPNLDWQAKFKGQALSQDQPNGTLAWGNEHDLVRTDLHSLDKNNEINKKRDIYLKTNKALHEGSNSSGNYLSKIPINVNKELMLRGKERYDIFCSVCHDKAGTGQGIVIKKGFPLAPNFSDEYLVEKSDGYIFDVITNGIRNMPGYGKKLTAEDRWAVVAYVRALQKSRNANLNDVPAELRDKIK